jgi:proteic killer suppression protein
LAELRIPPGNQLEVLSGNRNGQYSIRINDQYRICFQWTENGPDQVEIGEVLRDDSRILDESSIALGSISGSKGIKSDPGDHSAISTG